PPGQLAWTLTDVAACVRSAHMNVKKPAPTAPAISHDHQGAPGFCLRATYCACCLVARASGRPFSSLPASATGTSVLPLGPSSAVWAARSSSAFLSADGAPAGSV